MAYEISRKTQEDLLETMLKQVMTRAATIAKAQLPHKGLQFMQDTPQELFSVLQEDVAGLNRALVYNDHEQIRKKAADVVNLAAMIYTRTDPQNM